MSISSSSRITSKGQVTIPAEIRQRFGAIPGGLVQFEERGGELILHVRRSRVDEFFGIAKGKIAPMTDEELDLVIEDAFSQGMLERGNRS